MAAEFPSNFNDGEHFLMSEFFFNPHPRLLQRRHNHFRHEHFLCMDELSHNFSALSLLQRRKSLHNFELERVKPPVQGGPVSVGPQFPGHFGANGDRELGRRIHEYGTGSISSGPKRVYDVQFLKQTQARLESYMKERTNRFLEGQRNRLLQQNRGLPYQGSGFGFNGGLPRDNGGTGVFHPRIKTYTNSVSTASVAKNQGVDYRKKTLAAQQKYSMKRSAEVLGNQWEYHLPSDMGLPRDWTY